MKTLFIIRGLPGSGKTTLAKSIADVYFEADQYFERENGDYIFDPKRLKLAHIGCSEKVYSAMKDEVEKIAVSNTSTKEWEFEHYLKMADDNGYQTFCIVVENRHEGASIHNVPDGVIKAMRDRFELKL